MKAAIFDGPGQALRVADVQLSPPRADEVLVRLEAAGACHSDLNYIRGTRTVPLPIVLGHEGAGVIEAVGDGVESVQPGDHVVLNWRGACGSCDQCARGDKVLCRRADEVSTYCARPDGTSAIAENGQLVHLLDGLGTFAEYCVAPEQSVVPIPADIPFDVAALLGCSLLTGMCSVLEALAEHPAESVLVSGCGAVGLSCVLGARLAQVPRVVAVDLVESRLAAASRLGATHVALAGGHAPRAAVELAGGEVDLAFEASGADESTRNVLECLRPGGRVVLIGLKADDSPAPVAQNDLIVKRLTVSGSLYGTRDPEASIRSLAHRLRSAELPLDILVGRTFGLGEIEDAYDDLLAGRVGRNIVRPHPQWHNRAP